MLTGVDLALLDPVELGFTRAIGAMVQMTKAAGKNVIQRNTLIGKSLLKLEEGEFWRRHFKDCSVGATTIMYVSLLTYRVMMEGLIPRLSAVYLEKWFCICRNYFCSHLICFL